MKTTGSDNTASDASITADITQRQTIAANKTIKPNMAIDTSISANNLRNMLNNKTDHTLTGTYVNGCWPKNLIAVLKMIRSMPCMKLKKPESVF